MDRKYQQILALLEQRVQNDGGLWLLFEYWITTISFVFGMEISDNHLDTRHFRFDPPQEMDVDPHQEVSGVRS